MLNRCTLPCNEIEEPEWLKFYGKILPARQLHHTRMYDVTRPIDGEFTIDELCLALKQSNINKAGGPDGTSNEIYKNLPPCGTLYLLAVFNEIWSKEMVPQD